MDTEHLGQLREIVVPRTWSIDELDYAAMPPLYPSGAGAGKLLVVHVPGRMFGPYESGRLVRWGRSALAVDRRQLLMGSFT